MGRSEKLRFGLALALGVFVPGMLKYALTAAGYAIVGTAVWAVGYLAAILLIWYVWVRPIDFEGARG